MERDQIKTIAEKHLRNLTFESGESSWNYFKKSGTLNGSALDAIVRLVKECAVAKTTTSESELPVGSVVVSLPTDSREFKEWQQSNSIERLTGTNDYSWGGFIYQRLFFLEKFMEAQNKSN